MNFTIKKEYIPHFILFLELVVLVIVAVVWALLR